MKSVIAGTAGHIDHGKTALVRALTGIDADRLEEEKRRGITIDIGFAHMELPNPNGETLRLGFVDVPGHERFVRNMLAGVGGIDFVVLVIAADESIKPQTREHFEICRLLNIRSGLVVLTKSDLVDAETLEVVRLEVEDFLRGSFLEGAPILTVSSKTGAGLEQLRHALAQLAADVPARDSQAIPRLPIDRVFTIKGFGTVVTGTLVAGTICREQELELYPVGKRVRVRGIQVHGSSADQAVAGQRTALNLAGASTDELARGMIVSPPGLFRSTRRLDVQVTLLPDAHPLRDHARLHFHCYTAETIAELVLFPDVEKTETQSARSTQRGLAPGQTAWAQLRLAEPLPLLPGDRFILRQFSPVVTIGGGVVIDAAPLSGRHQRKQAQEALARLAGGTAQEVLEARVLRRAQRGLSVPDAVAETGWEMKRLQAAIAALLKEKKALLFSDVLISRGAFSDAGSAAVSAVAAFHQANPLVAGIGKEELRERVGLGPAVFGGMLDALVREKKIEAAGEQIHQPGRGVVMKEEEAESKRQIEHAFASAGLKVPALKEVLAGLKIDRTRAQKIVTLLLRDRVLIKVSDDLVFHCGALDSLRDTITAFKAKSPKIDVAAFKELTGVSRKYAIPLLEYLDRERVTRRVGDERVIL